MFGDLDALPSFHVKQHHDLLLPRRQRRECHRKPFAHLGVDQLLVGQCIGRGRVGQLGFGVPHLSCAQLVDAQVAKQREEPRPERPVGIEEREAVEGAQECILHEVFRIGPVTQQPLGGDESTREVAPDERIERRRIAAPRATDQRRLFCVARQLAGGFSHPSPQTRNRARLLGAPG